MEPVPLLRLSYTISTLECARLPSLIEIVTGHNGYSADANHMRVCVMSETTLKPVFDSCSVTAHAVHAVQSSATHFEHVIKHRSAVL
jgi:hypothetical protein